MNLYHLVSSLCIHIVCIPYSKVNSGDRRRGWEIYFPINVVRTVRTCIHSVSHQANSLEGGRTKIYHDIRVQIWKASQQQHYVHACMQTAGRSVFLCIPCVSLLFTTEFEINYTEENDNSGQLYVGR